MTNKNQKNEQRVITLEGMMTFGKCENGLHTADFVCCEDVEAEPFTAVCKVQAMRDGNVYVTEMPRRVRNKALFRDDNCSLSRGQNGRYYFVFSIDENQLDQLPLRLVRQAGNIAQKVLKEVICRK
ncbi:MAG: hypothetical protein J6T94_08550 [Bacteroidaceae bacterium]|nr:hypothetical protein [Bacteroidaceae bacterium]